MGSAISGELRYLADGPQGRRAVGPRVRRPPGVERGFKYARRSHPQGL